MHRLKGPGAGAVGLALWLSACGGPSIPAADPARPAPEARPKAREVIPVPAVLPAEEGHDAGGSVGLAFEGVGALHRGFFSTPELVGKLAGALQPCLRGDGIVQISYDTGTRVGRITLEVPPGGLACAAALDGDGLTVEGLEPVGRALAAYRDGVAGAFDLRVASFRAELRVASAPPCLLRMGGTFPPDGRAWHRCVELGGRAVCQEADASEGVPFKLPDAEAQRALRACFGG